MKRSLMTVFAAGTVLVVGACAPDDDQAQVPQVDEVHTPAPVMPQDTMMMDTVMHHDTMMHHDTLPAPGTVPPQP